MVEDFDRIERTVGRRVIDVLDHSDLNHRIENPTAENIALWIWKRLERALGALDEIVVWETPTACAVVRRDDLLSPAAR
jgi:6-pyruvoyltetrahydropterin/6-carboxytetrahydropterin synthase